MTSPRDKPSPRDKVVALIESGRVSPEEGQRLLDALDDERRAPGWRVLFDPFEGLSTAHGLLVVALGVALQIVGSRMGVRYDGALDVHIASAPTWFMTFLELAIDLGLTTLVAWAAAFALASRPRAIDVLIAIGIARVPLVIVGLPLVALLPDPETLRQQALSADLSWVYGLVAVLVLPAIVWSFVLWFRGYRTATGLAGGRLWGAFFGSILVAELLTKLALAIVG
jgi:hypothetical protein